MKPVVYNKRGGEEETRRKAMGVRLSSEKR